MQLLKRIAARLPDRWQLELKRLHFGRQIGRGTFATAEPEYRLLGDFVAPGDWVVDVGANVGHYTKRLSELVGPRGRVLAFEPVPTTFSLLSANVQLFAHANVTLFNAAASDGLDVVGMAMPEFETGLTNYYAAHVADGADGGLSVLALPLDALGIDRHVSLVKIDTEGHEARVLSGMGKLIEAHRPMLVIETTSQEVIDDLASRGYVAERLRGSPNVLFRPGP
jgi:FkbM family methyltransferase